MYAYEIRIIRTSGSPSIILAETQLTDVAAIRSARKIARGKPFEVWRDLECISGIGQLQP
jgi:hypothetical protein